MSDSTPSLSRTYSAHKIEFSPSDLKFHVTGPEFDKLKPEYCTFSSFDEARTKIDSEVAGAKRLAAKNLKFSETVITEFGDVLEITSINRNSAEIKDAPGKYVYPNAPWIAEALKRQRQLRVEVNSIEDSISPLRISISRGYGRIDADSYPDKLLSLQKTINEKLEQATQNPPASAEIVELKTQSES